MWTAWHRWAVTIAMVRRALRRIAHITAAGGAVDRTTARARGRGRGHWAAVLHYPGQSASSLVACERGHLTGPEIFRFARWMMLVASLVVLPVVLPYWTAAGEPLIMSPGK